MSDMGWDWNQAERITRAVEVMASLAEEQLTAKQAEHIQLMQYKDKRISELANELIAEKKTTEKLRTSLERVVNSEEA